MEFIGYLAAILIGITLGLVGAGGSILSIPVLVYLFGITPIDATSYSLIIVAVSSLIGSYKYFKDDLVSIPTILTFGLPSLVSIFLTRKILLHAIPEHLFSVGEVEITKNIGLMILLAILMVLAAYYMIKKPKLIQEESEIENKKYKTLLIILQGLLVGLLAGLVGSGGGFLILPALVLLAKLPMKKAIGTTLAIVTINSFVGFFSDFSNHQFDWTFLTLITSLSVIGIFIGRYISKFISGAKLKPIFGYFILVTGLYIILKELFL